ncbi:DUF3299 domain-containing protein [Palleronia sp. KMU-117]|uniref:DUF3299 domain-containing protein n=1 Tax=Palleronia sp. KMU-117 TaxID=3434108 RepID=UPI003D7327B6
MWFRRDFLTSLLSAVAAAATARAARALDDAVVVLDWSDLAPSLGGTEMERLRALGVVEHGQLDTPFDQELGGQITHAYDGKRVRIPGFLLPLDFSGTGVTDFLLVPYVGACIHVPPPPPNQLILVTTDAPYESDGLFEPVSVTGTMTSMAATTQFAEVGYAIAAETVEPYEF